MQNDIPMLKLTLASFYRILATSGTRLVTQHRSLQDIFPAILCSGSSHCPRVIYKQTGFRDYIICQRPRIYWVVSWDFNPENYFSLVCFGQISPGSYPPLNSSDLQPAFLGFRAPLQDPEMFLRVAFFFAVQHHLPPQCQMIGLAASLSQVTHFPTVASTEGCCEIENFK